MAGAAQTPAVKSAVNNMAYRTFIPILLKEWRVPLDASSKVSTASGGE